MKWRIEHIDETDSTNQWLKANGHAEDTVVWTDFQTAGRGQGTNRWESERHKNLTFSMLYHPKDMSANSQFVLSMTISLAICDALEQYIGDVSIKWPNDIYWRNGKLGGILIEHQLHGNRIRSSIIGVGLNVNQQVFHSDAPNPVSLWQISSRETDREELLHHIIANFDKYKEQPVKDRYMAKLYRRKGFHPYADKEGPFMAELTDVEDDGHLLLQDETGQLRRYAFKEVTFIL